MLLTFSILVALTVPALGRTLGQPFIWNGKRVDVVGKYPYQASYQNYGYHSCGAAIISSRYLITAAHCCSTVSPYDSVVVGAHDIKTKTDGDPRSYNLTSTTKHPDYEKGTGRNEADICIITLSTDIDMTNPYVGTIDLPAVGSTEDFVGDDCIITGWGATKWVRPNILREAHTKPLSLPACKDAAAKLPGTNESDIVASHICVGAEGSKGPGACHGDSGGPLSCPSSGDGHVLAGVTSWGDPDCDPQYPSVYTRITSFRDWIKENTGI